MKIEEEIRQNKFKSPHQKALLNLIFTYNWIHNKQQDFFRQFGLTPQQFNILRILRGQHPNGISATEIKSRMLDKNSDISRLLDRLLLKNLVEKKTCPSDKRASDVFISSEGLALLEEVGKFQKEMDQVLQLNEEEATALSELLDRCRGIQ
jgi:DNA-binding MarR family transcriptional regulator